MDNSLLVLNRHDLFLLFISNSCASPYLVLEILIGNYDVIVQLDAFKIIQYYRNLEI